MPELDELLKAKVSDGERSLELRPLHMHWQRVVLVTQRAANPGLRSADGGDHVIDRSVA